MLSATAPALRHLRLLLGGLILAAGLGLLAGEAWQALASTHDARLGQALLAGLIAAAATALGTLPALGTRQLPARVQDALTGFGAGVMLAACSFSLILPGLAAARTASGAGSAALQLALALLLGAWALMALDRWLPHEHFIKGREGRACAGQARRSRRALLFAMAVTLHNLPEGLAMGVAFAGGDTPSASRLSLAIAIQDLPEGFVIAAALMAVGYARAPAMALGMASGLVEPLGALLGVGVVSQWPALLPWGLGFAAGAMLFVISHEIIPESHRQGHERWATQGLMLGFALMMVLDTALG
ncbi:ZIP family metal transporter [Pelomonas sp. CA6]|uniref:ZIP family metal transporter n=1 Tax=Pelomonas sp. CA6 TaxID=2907999 RepID=UPI001F4C135E|nr:ZIP family metal transporter [Pelomonas sp. CA6]MCH7343223.1 ZIP family metal transporter [Pelomonas sp. CA6]